ncbi:MAG: 5-oxoprolinase subunit PxpA [Chitinophagaceae bacterium]
MLPLDLNCDMGESTHLHHYDVSNDLALFPFLSSINIACGAYAGDAQTMHTLVDQALRSGIAVGAHPGYADRNNFGRTAIKLPSREIHELVLSQVKLLQDVLTDMGKRLHHVKPHGALYNSAASDPELAEAICTAIAEAGRDILLYGLSGSCMQAAAEEQGIRFVSEVYADRSYENDGSLTPRTVAGAILTDPAACEKQLLDMALHGSVKTSTGNYISVRAESICLHADGTRALEFAILIRKALKKHHITVTCPS